MSSETPEIADVRSFTVAQLKALVPDTWDVKPGLATPGTLSQTTLYIEYKTIERLAEAPQSGLTCTFEATVATQLTDLAKGEDDVDASVVELLVGLNRHEQITWTLAEKKSIAGANLGWALTLKVIALPIQTPETPEEPEE